MPPLPKRKKPLPPGMKCGCAVKIDDPKWGTIYGDLQSEEIVNGKVLVLDAFPPENEDGYLEVPIDWVSLDTGSGDDGGLTNLPPIEVITPVPTPKSKKQTDLSNLFAAKKLVKKDLPHLLIRALAGTAKTTSLLEGARLLRGADLHFFPTEQQQDILNEVYLSKGVGHVTFCAFTSDVAAHLRSKAPLGCTVLTTYSLGWKALQQAVPNIKFSKTRLWNIVNEVCKKELPKELPHHASFEAAIYHLVELCKLNLIPTDCHDSNDEQELWRLFDQFSLKHGIPLGPYGSKSNREQIYRLVPTVIARCLNVYKDRCADYTDQIWLPVVLNLPLFKHDVLMCDECQDLSICQQSLLRRSAHRLILCGDENQAIFGFAGADTDSMKNLRSELSNSVNGCTEKSLTLSRRCAKRIVQEAQRIVPEFEALPDAPEGVVTDLGLHVVGLDPGTGSNLANYLVVSRVGLPLISMYMSLWNHGVSAILLGRDIGLAIRSVVNEIAPQSIAQLRAEIVTWRDRCIEEEMKEDPPSEQAIHRILDIERCITLIATRTPQPVDLNSFNQRMNVLFNQATQDHVVKLATIHRAKGLEADIVHYLNPRQGPTTARNWQEQQEINLQYVAITRAKSRLIYTQY